MEDESAPVSISVDPVTFPTFPTLVIELVPAANVQNAIKRSKRRYLPSLCKNANPITMLRSAKLGYTPTVYGLNVGTCM